jgi:hypothetical protein
MEIPHILSHILRMFPAGTKNGMPLACYVYYEVLGGAICQMLL